MDLASEVALDAEFSKRYELGSRLGEGGMGTVHRGLHRLLDRPVAVKFMRPELLLEEEPKKRFLSEARVAASLLHTNVCVVLDFGFAGRVPYLVTELVDGQSLQDVLRSGRMPPERVLALVKEVLDGLEAIHALSIVHRDLKPANILVTRDGRPKILDFGLAKAFAGDRAVDGATVPGMVVGTPSYMSPEQACADPLAASSDLYSLTVVLYEMIVGRPPFVSDSYLDLMKKHRFDPPPIPAELLEPVRALLARGLAKTPRERFETAAAFRDAVLALERVVTASGSFFALPANAADPDRTLMPPSVPPETRGTPSNAPAPAPAGGTGGAAPVRSAALVGLALFVAALALKPRVLPPEIQASRPAPSASSTASGAPPSRAIKQTPEELPVGHKTPAERFRSLHDYATRRTLEGVNTQIAELRIHQHDKIGNLAALRVPANRVASGLDVVLVELLEMVSGTPSLEVSSPLPMGNWELLLKDAGEHIAARRYQPLARSLENFVADPASAAAATHDPLGLHHGTAFDWLLGVALLGDPRTPEDLRAAVSRLEEVADAHPAQPLGAWAAEELAALDGRAGLPRLHEHFRTLAAKHREALGKDATTFPHLEAFHRAVIARIALVWGGRPDLAPLVLKATLGPPAARRQAARIAAQQSPH